MLIPDENRLMTWLAQLLRCPVCGQPTSPDRAQLLQHFFGNREEKPRLVVRSDCENCRSSVVFNVALAGSSPVSVSVITDFSSEEEAKNLSRRTPLSADDIIAFCEFFASYRGKF